ncbi:MAG TPA: hypothetical protein VK528_08765 [Flavobacterium sp.]|nr:hypothetical protein [Flavobacterium sp.]
MIKNLLLPVFLLFSLATLAQQGTASPYSFYGIGEIKFKGAAENRLMGTVAVFPDSIHINMQNPASYSSLKLTTFTVGGSFNSSKFTTYRETENAQRSTVDYLAVGLPVGKKIGVAFGLIPYSSVGYRIRSVDPINGTIRKYNGTGGLNKAFVGLGYKINSDFSVGADFSYNFGKVETTNIVYVPGDQFGTEEMDNSDLSGVNFNLGAMYKTKIHKKYDFYGSLAFTPQSNVTSDNERILGTIVFADDYTPGIIEALDTQKTKVTIKLPSKFAFGAGFGKERKWLVGTEITLQQTSNFGNRFTDISNATYENSIKYAVGGYYIPNYTSFSSYLSKVTYRAGFRYENTGLVLNNETIRDYAVSGGFGFPLGGTFSNLNMGVEYGRKGTAKALLVEENYLNVIFSLSLNDQWFVKRRYD